MNVEALRRYNALSACLTLIEATLRAFSRNQASIEPLEGYETAFLAEREKADIIREMMRELRYGKEEARGVSSWQDKGDAERC